MTIDELTGVLAAHARPHRTSAAEQVADELRRQIIRGRLRPGTQLIEETLSTALGYSRNTIRESFLVLASERIVERRPHRGVFVSSPGIDEVRAVYAARRLLEPAAAQHGAAFTAEAVAALRSVVDQAHRARSAGDRDGVAQANQDFHRGIVALGGSSRLDALMEDLLAQMRLVFHLMADVDASFHDDFVDLNDAVVTALESRRRGEAARTLRDYLDTAEARLLSTMETWPSHDGPTGSR